MRAENRRGGRGVDPHDHDARDRRRPYIASGQDGRRGKGSRRPPAAGSGAASPGELRKLMLAQGLLGAPELVVMDEPANHLDIASIEALQRVLADCPCALVLVSHDAPFLEATTHTRWQVERDGDGVSRVRAG